MLARLRKVILGATPGLTEEWKWGTAVWSLKGNVVAVGVFKDHLKINFFKGASLTDPTWIVQCRTRRQSDAQHRSL